MGKYNSNTMPLEFQDVEQKSELFFVLRAIANEIAESNRLKRLELSLTKLPENSEKLEDQA